MAKRSKSFIDISTLVRKNILNMKPYSSARDEFKGEAEIFLDANENPYPSPYNRYPDPKQRLLKDRIAELKDVRAGSDLSG
jgi:histidinol-phosphate aminotransferase